ncbi:MAG: SagB/ThcOx family dehydrogenase [Thermodesulfovibrionales bacterium]|nr:SagB/ThcOx family dehydrogenase [Thermodesulfovibrionales bacterium]
MDKNTIDTFRYFLKDSIRLEMDFSLTDQSRGIAPPPIQKPYPPDAQLIELPSFDRIVNQGFRLFDAIEGRRSIRSYKNRPLSLDELAYLLYCCQGIQKVISPSTALRTVPSAGCRHSFETYLCVINVEGLKKGIYRYLPLNKQLLVVYEDNKADEKIVASTLGQSFTGKSAVVFIWSAIPYRMEWRYGLAAHKVIAIDAGHVCQNLYLSAEAVGCGVCAIGAYHQEMMDNLIGVDGHDEFVIYLASVGKI